MQHVVRFTTNTYMVGQKIVISNIYKREWNIYELFIQEDKNYLVILSTH